MLKDFSLAEIREYIDWSPFFFSWDLKGKYPKILNDKKIGSAAQELFDNGQKLLDEIVEKRLIKANAVYGFWPAASDGEDVILFDSDDRNNELARLHFLRQQWERKGQNDFRCLADYIAPVNVDREDYLGGFVVTAGLGADELAKEYENKHDDYNAIMVKSLADRLAEAFAELLHKRAREEWGFGLSEQLDNEALIAEKYRGFRPAAGYPACPDHTEKRTLFDLLDATNATGVELTQSYAMWPGASVSGLYFGHPAARYFAVDRVTEDQVRAYAKRKGISLTEAERWLAPNLGYEAK